jgi:hypothetical protein
MGSEPSVADRAEVVKVEGALTNDDQDHDDNTGDQPHRDLYPGHRVLFTRERRGTWFGDGRLVLHHRVRFPNEGAASGFGEAVA